MAHKFIIKQGLVSSSLSHAYHMSYCDKGHGPSSPSWFIWFLAVFYDLLDCGWGETREMVIALTIVAAVRPMETHYHRRGSLTAG